MSRAKIIKALAAKGLSADPEYIRGHSGGGWMIGLTEDAEDALMGAGYDGDFDPDPSNTGEALAWVEQLPNCQKELA